MILAEHYPAVAVEENIIEIRRKRGDRPSFGVVDSSCGTEVKCHTLNKTTDGVHQRMLASSQNYSLDLSKPKTYVKTFCSKRFQGFPGFQVNYGEKRNSIKSTLISLAGLLVSAIELSMTLIIELCLWLKVELNAMCHLLIEAFNIFRPIAAPRSFRHQTEFLNYTRSKS